MKKLPLMLVLLAGCASPLAPVSRTVRVSLGEVSRTYGFEAGGIGGPVSSGIVPVTVPTWTFEVNGNYRIEASTNLVNWWPVAVVYSVTNITLSSDTVAKYPALFYRVQPEK
jgi:hypothetical protein